RRHTRSDRDWSSDVCSSDLKRLKVLALTDNVPVLTAWANDTDYERVFAAQMENFVTAGDVAFGISGSGNSASVLRALQLAREKRSEERRVGKGCRCRCAERQ